MKKKAQSVVIQRPPSEVVYKNRKAKSASFIWTEFHSKGNKTEDLYRWFSKELK